MRWWAVAALALSVGLNAGLLVAVLQQRWLASGSGPEAAAEEGSPEAARRDEATSGASAAVAGAPEAAPSARLVEGRALAGAAEEAAAAAGSPGVEGNGATAPPATSAAGEPGTADGAEPSPRPGDGRGTGALVAPQRSAGTASEPAERGEAPLPPRLQEMADRLAIPPEIRPRFFALQRRFLAAAHEQRLRLDSVRRELRAELVAPQPDRGRVDELLRQSTELQAALERTFVDHVFAARELLDGEAEQRYLQLLSRLGPVGPGGPRPQPPWQRQPGARQRRFGPGG